MAAMVGVTFDGVKLQNVKTPPGIGGGAKRCQRSRADSRLCHGRRASPAGPTRTRLACGIPNRRRRASVLAAGSWEPSTGEYWLRTGRPLSCSAHSVHAPTAPDTLPTTAPLARPAARSRDRVSPAASAGRRAPATTRCSPSPCRVIKAQGPDRGRESLPGLCAGFVSGGGLAARPPWCSAGPAPGPKQRPWFCKNKRPPLTLGCCVLLLAGTAPRAWDRAAGSPARCACAGRGAGRGQREATATVRFEMACGPGCDGACCRRDSPPWRAGASDALSLASRPAAPTTPRAQPAGSRSRTHPGSRALSAPNCSRALLLPCSSVLPSCVKVRERSPSPSASPPSAPLRSGSQARTNPIAWLRPQSWSATRTPIPASSLAYIYVTASTLHYSTPATKPSPPSTPSGARNTA